MTLKDDGAAATAHLEDNFNNPDVQEHGCCENSFENIELVIDLPSIDLVEELHKPQRT